jgi:rod shape-determining protein MreD
MIRLIFALVLLSIIFAQATFIPRMNPFPLTPDLALVVLFFWLTRRSLRESLVWIFAVGVVLDVLAMDSLGVHALAMLPLAALAYPLKVRPWHFHIFSVMALVLLGSIVHGTLLSVLRGNGITLDVGLLAVVQTMLVPIVYVVFRFFARR